MSSKQKSVEEYLESFGADGLGPAAAGLLTLLAAEGEFTDTQVHAGCIRVAGFYRGRTKTPPPSMLQRLDTRTLRRLAASLGNVASRVRAGGG